MNNIPVGIHLNRISGKELKWNRGTDTSVSIYLQFKVYISFEIVCWYRYHSIMRYGKKEFYCWREMIIGYRIFRISKTD